MGLLQADDLDSLEEHLLVCARCQDQLKQIEDYRTAMRAAAASLNQADERRKHFWTRVSTGLTFGKLGWAMAALAVGLLVVALRLSVGPGVTQQAVAVALETTRGSEIAHAPSGRPLALTLNITGLQASSIYGVEVVDSGGKTQFATQAAATEERFKTLIPAKLPPGTYFVRLYSPSRELLREYGLQLD